MSYEKIYQLNVGLSKEKEIKIDEITQEPKRVKTGFDLDSQAKLSFLMFWWQIE